MPIIGWYCQKCRANVPLDHFDQCDAVHPDFAAAVLAGNLAERNGIHVTSLLTCSRKAAIEQAGSVYVDPVSYNAILSGIGWHELMQRSSSQPELCEVEVSGDVGGTLIAGRVDRIHPPQKLIDDWKCTSEFAEKWLKQGGAKAEHVAQLSLYAELIEQALGWRPLKGRLWYRTHKAVLTFTVDLWSLDQVLAFHPLGGDFSVAELLSQLDRFYRWQTKTGALRLEWYEMPLAGESMKYGAKSACDYCAVRETCYTQAKGAPF